jgi:death-on-curing protein
VTEPIWIDAHDAFAIHEQVLAKHGGKAGLNNSGLLESALARPQQHQAYGEAPDFIDLAAVYTAGIVQNHSFIDGNKRTGFVVGIIFLELNGYHFTASEVSAAQAILDLAAGILDEIGYANFLHNNVKR